MSFRNLTATDVSTAIAQQNIQVAAGQIGQPPIPNGQVFQYTMTTLGRLEDAEQFANIILKTDTDGRIVRLQATSPGSSWEPRGTTRPVPSTASPRSRSRSINGQARTRSRPPTSSRTRWKSSKQRFPEGVDYSIVYDTTPFITESVNEVFKTLRDAVILVAVVVLLFLQNWRSALIPLIAVPVAIVGTAAVMAAMGFSLNNLTLFGLVLAIGIVVDDAIVVVEAVEHHVEHGMNPRDATIRAMDEVSGPVIAIGLVLTAVFVPCAFISGNCRPVLPPVRSDDRDFNSDLGVQLVDSEPGSGRYPHQARSRGKSPRRCPASPTPWPARGWPICCSTRSSIVRSCRLSSRPRIG